LEEEALNPSRDQMFWNASIASNPPEVPFDSVMAKGDGTGMANLTEKIVSHEPP
jgi:hypothetical protein